MSRAVMSSDGSSIQLSTGESLRVGTLTRTASGIGLIAPDDLPNPFLYTANSRQDRRKGKTNNKSDDRAKAATSSTYKISPIPAKTTVPQHKRSRESLEDSDDNSDQDKHQSKKLKLFRLNHEQTNDTDYESCLSEQSDVESGVQPATPTRKTRRRQNRQKDRRVRSSPGLSFSIHAELENDQDQQSRPTLGRRVWSANNVLDALSVGRAEADEHAADTTPPHSPLFAPANTPISDNLYSLRIPKKRQVSEPRLPLANVTSEFVPDFLVETSPDLQGDTAPPSPGAWNGPWKMNVHEDRNQHSWDDADETLLGMDGSFDSTAITETPGDGTQMNRVNGDTFGSPEDNFLRANDEEKKSIETSATRKTPKVAPDASQVLAGLTSDAKFLADALNQINSLKSRVERHTRRRLGLAKQFELTTNNQRLAAKFMREAKKCEEVAKKAAKEAKEYCRKAKKLVRNAGLEVERFEADEIVGTDDDVEEDDAEEDDDEDEDDDEEEEDSDAEDKSEVAEQYHFGLGLLE